MATFHIYKRVGRARKQINLCGAQTHFNDVSIQRARELVQRAIYPAGLERCERCFGKLLDLDFKQSEKVED